MKARDLLSLVEAKPFRPFRLQLTDGAVVNVAFPMMLVNSSRAIVVTRYGFDENGRPYAEDYRTLSLNEIALVPDERPT